MSENKKITIVLVDDDKFLLDMYSMKFKNMGMDIIAIASGPDFLAKAREGLKADIVLLDIIMPNIDGIEILETIRREKLLKDSVIVMLTNQADDEDKAKKLGIDGFIIKAMNIPSEVVSKVMDIYKKKS
jgi:CheY-like chemotaxis protein